MARPEPRPGVGRGSKLSRAAILAGATALAGVGCGSSGTEATHDETYEQQGDTQGDERTVEAVDAGVDQGDQQVEPDIQAMPYGAPPPPVRRALV